MKKALSFILMVAILTTAFAVSANENHFSSNGLYKLSGQVVGVCEMEQIIDEEAIGDEPYYVLHIDTNATIFFDTPVDTLYVSDDEKGGETYFEFMDGVRVSGEVCTVNYQPAYRMDSAEYYSLEVDLENEVEYMKENASVRFNKPGIYLLTATLGAVDGNARIEQLVEKTNRGDTYYSQPGVIFNVIVTGETASESIDEFQYYDEKVFSVSGITGYDNSRSVMYENTVAMCTSPVVITANSDLRNMCITKLENIGGQWVEARYFDGLAINLGDTTKNWYPGEGFENSYDSCFEFTGTEEEYGEEAMAVKKGTSVSFAEPGMYTVWGDSVAGDYTGLVFEIADTQAAYTDSKVLVDGKEIKFEAYNINDNNYFKLRDIAFALTNYGTGGKKFNVKWDEERNMINLLSGFNYETVGGELAEGDGRNKSYKASSSALMKDGKNVILTAYNINDNNYFKLRDLGKLFDFNVSWDGVNNCILIDTGASYME